MMAVVMPIALAAVTWLFSDSSYNAFLTPAAAQSTRQCYTPAGEVLGDYIPCNKSSDSDCCQESDACLSNGLCFNAREGLVYRGACTRRDWNTDSCRQMCPRCQFLICSAHFSPLCPISNLRLAPSYASRLSPHSHF
jgi:hypothetical protein